MTSKSNQMIVSNPVYLEQHQYTVKTDAEYKFIPVPELNNLHEYSEIIIRYYLLAIQKIGARDFEASNYSA